MDRTTSAPISVLHYLDALTFNIAIEYYRMDVSIKSTLLSTILTVTTVGNTAETGDIYAYPLKEYYNTSLLYTRFHFSSEISFKWRF